MGVADLAFLQWQAGEEVTRQKNVAQARDYFAGEHAISLTDRQREFLGVKSGGRFAVNYCSTVVSAVCERLIVDGVQCDNEPLSEWAWNLWQANRMDAGQMDVHEAAVRDGEAFVMVDWDLEQDRPRFTFHPRYVSSENGGDGFGCKSFYPNNDYRLPMSYASKRWSETVTKPDGSTTTRQRLTLYYPERVEKYVLGWQGRGSEAGWAPFMDEDPTWPLPWTDGAGRPLGIPVVHFQNPGLESELWDAVPLQDAINKAMLDLLGAQDLAGIPIFFAKGFYATTDGNPPESDGSNYLTLAPGQIIGTTSEDGSFERVPPGDMKPMLETFWSLVQTMAQVTDTPTSRFQLTRQVSSAEAQKESEGPLLAKLRARQVNFGNAWEDALDVARRLQNVYGEPTVDEMARFSMTWAPAQPRDEKAHIEQLALKREKLGVPLEQIWAEAGYSQEDIDRMKGSDEYKARQAMMTMGLGASSAEPDRDDDEAEAG